MFKIKLIKIKDYIEMKTRSMINDLIINDFDICSCDYD